MRKRLQQQLQQQSNSGLEDDVSWTPTVPLHLGISSLLPKQIKFKPTHTHTHTHLRILTVNRKPSNQTWRQTAATQSNLQTTKKAGNRNQIQSLKPEPNAGWKLIVGSWNDMEWREMEWNYARWTERRKNEILWSEMRGTEMAWDQRKWKEITWNDMTWNGMKWNEMKWNEMKWNENDVQCQQDTSTGLGNESFCFGWILYFLARPL